MTAQIPDKIENMHNSIELGDLHLYRIIARSGHTGSPFSSYSFQSSPSRATPGISSALARGYISCYTLTESGELILDRYEYPYERLKPLEQVGEKLTGNFLLDMRKGFFQDRLYIPFINGRIVTDKTMWVVEKKKTKDELFEESTRQYLEAHPCRIDIAVACHPDLITDKFSIYIDGNIPSTRDGKQPIDGYSARASVGRHRIIIRETDYRKPDRMESNTVYFDTSIEKPSSFLLKLEKGNLILLEV
ncbi:hypothetical protein [Hahella sp. NBU794]|uniref:hypothetical protein n=1 Tax=Hahella sp. NBU794 TaxID=3422590 RepID=UPI003D6FD933